ncbi:MAG TPA: NAD-dependent epimerase/dehydratase family protein [Verrucomicrobiales bacterium]|nr:NAD-dependent epimerase/dehydratase family protein [Verrucomicrobiae bacterium]MCP5554069.1 NAD-dependent epimerase/dehydratase family protein [Akkermansiaceae bacterium]HRX53997.1 NAD-dependent epimerase/dehydratase family protein [Verrucomicrobiales bacterium]
MNIRNNNGFHSNKATLDRLIVVTGAAGFIGSHTTDELLSLGHRVVGVDDLSTGRIGNLGESMRNDRFEFVKADVSGPEMMDWLCQRYQPAAIIHLAGLVSVVAAQENPGRNYRLNLHATQQVAEAARSCGVPRVVFASSAATYGNTLALPVSEETPTRPEGLYGSCKLASEHLLQGYASSFDLEVVCLRYFNVYGSRQTGDSPYAGVISKFVEGFSSGKGVTVFGDGRQSRDFIHVRDVARANALAATVPLELRTLVANVCTGRQQSLNEVLSVFGNLFPHAPAPRRETARRGEILHSCGDPAIAKRHLGFQARTTLDEGLRHLIDHSGISISA